MILDGGPVEIGLESTIVDLSEEQPVILRPGYISRQMLESVVGPVGVDGALLSADSNVRPKAPGMKYRHYAPRASLIIVEGPRQKVVEEICRLAGQGTREGEKIGIIAAEETAGAYRDGIVKTVGSREDELSIARHLYGILREFDEIEVTRIYSEAFDTPKMGQAIMNRLMKAAGHQMMKV